MRFGCTRKGENMEKAYLEFKHLPFKLAVIQVLMYDKKRILPEYLGGDLFFEQNPDFEELPEPQAIARLEQHIQEALAYFQALKIPASLAKEISFLYSGDELDVYYHINPQWLDYDAYFDDGRLFDITDISESEIRQFPNLKAMQFNMIHAAPAALIQKLHQWGIETEE